MYNMSKCIEGKTREYRRVWREHHGELPKGMMIRHSCHNQKCCNIEHLSIGTAADNRADDMRNNPKWPWKPKGSKDPNSKLTEADARYILEMKKYKVHGDKMHLKLAEEFGVNQSIIYNIWNRTYWKHI